MEIGKSIHYLTGSKIHESVYRTLRFPVRDLIAQSTWEFVNQTTNIRIWESVTNSERLWK